MGLGSWAVAAIVALLVARWIRMERDRRWKGEAIASLTAAAVCGVLATALDFGGWNEPDWRAALFAFFGALAAAGAVRLLNARRRAGARAPHSPSA